MVLKLLRRLATSSLGLQTICEAFNQLPECFDEAITLFIYGLSNKGKLSFRFIHLENTSFLHFDISEMHGPVMRFLTDLLILGQTCDYEFITLADLLNQLPLSANVKQSTRSFIFNADFIPQALVNWIENSENDSENGITAAEILYKQLANLFEQFNDNSTSNQLTIGGSDSCFESNCKAIEALLKCSEKARTLATNDQFLLLIVDQMDKIRSIFGGRLTDFIRRNGNTKV